MTKTVAVITTINEPTKAVKEFAKRIPLIVIGDEKTNGWAYCEVTDFEYYPSSRILPFSYQPPLNSYARKNLGYLLAMQQGAYCIYDTDDDNIPNENWKLRERESWAMQVIMKKGWCNVYDAFQDKYKIWPRGLPLTEVNNLLLMGEPYEIKSPIHQGLADNSPDVDAIWRLTRGEYISFEYQRSVYLPPGTWSPFNSQTTWWFKEAFPLMYLPQYCTMRMTDIIRSFVAQRCLWEMGYGVVFHSPSEVVQERNPHDLMKDFEDEILGYLHNDEIKIALDGLYLSGNDVLVNMADCYCELVRIGILPDGELYHLDCWMHDVSKIWKP